MRSRQKEILENEILDRYERANEMKTVEECGNERYNKIN